MSSSVLSFYLIMSINLNIKILLTVHIGILHRSRMCLCVCMCVYTDSVRTCMCILNIPTTFLRKDVQIFINIYLKSVDHWMNHLHVIYGGITESDLFIVKN